MSAQVIDEGREVAARIARIEQQSSRRIVLAVRAPRPRRKPHRVQVYTLSLFEFVENVLYLLSHQINPGHGPMNSMLSKIAATTCRPRIYQESLGGCGAVHE